MTMPKTYCHFYLIGGFRECDILRKREPVKALFLRENGYGIDDAFGG